MLINKQLQPGKSFLPEMLKIRKEENILKEGKNTQGFSGSTRRGYLGE